MTQEIPSQKLPSQTVAELGEFGLIARIRGILDEAAESSRPHSAVAEPLPQAGSAGDEVIVGPGDDAAVLRPAPGLDWVLTCDVQVAGRHFRPEWMGPRMIGRRAMAVNLSDIAAMGAVARHALISLGLPGAMRVADVEEIYRGFIELLQPAGGRIVGGNLSASGPDWFCDITLIGQVPAGRALTRSGARPGDRILVTGSTGRSAAGLAVLSHLETDRAPGGDTPRNAFDPAKLVEFEAGLDGFLATRPWARSLVDAYRDPVPRVEAGVVLRELAERSLRITSVIDLSDGLSGDLERICEESRVEAVLDASRLPVDPDLDAATAFFGRARAEWSLLPGDDYELLFTVDAGDAEAATGELLGRCGLAVTEVGEILPPREGSASRVHVAGTSRSAEGWDHFRH